MCLVISGSNRIKHKSNNAVCAHDAKRHRKIKIGTALSGSKLSTKNIVIHLQIGRYSGLRALESPKEESTQEPLNSIIDSIKED